MNCPYCNRDIYGMTGLQELQKFQKHLRKCKKYRLVTERGGDGRKVTKEVDKPTDMMTALEIRAGSGQ